MLASSLWKECGAVRDLDLDPKQKPDVQDRNFTERSTNVKRFTKLYPWGGRENEWNARDQKQIAESLKENGADTLEGRTSS
jgi:hypothetical protein